MSTDVSSKPPRWRWAVLGLLVVGALSVPTGIVFLQHRLQSHPRDSARPWDDPVIAKKLADGRLVKAKAIRAEWRAWALQHKTELRAMLDSKGKDFSTLQAVYKVSPPLNIGDWQPDTRNGPVKFGWYVDPKKWLDNGAKLLNGHTMDAAAIARTKAAIAVGDLEQLQRGEFDEKSDFQIARSESVGPTTTYLWASGRITEKTTIRNPHPGSGKPSLVELPHKDLVPPFDFLTSASSG